MSATELATKYARILVDRERRATGSVEAALQKTGDKAGLSRWAIWSLWYRRRKTVHEDEVGKLRGALIRGLEHEMRALEHELQILRASGADPRDNQITAVEASLHTARETLGLNR